MAGQIPIKAEQAERVVWLIRLRWWTVLGIGLALMVGQFLYPDWFPLLPLIAVTLGIVLYNARFSLYVRTTDRDRAKRKRPQVPGRMLLVQSILDLLALTALVHFSGGVESPLVPFWIWPTITACLLLPRRATVFVTSSAILLFTLVAGFEYASIIPHYHPPILEDIEVYRYAPYMLMVISMMSILLALVAYTTSSHASRLSERERQVAHELQMALDDCQELARVSRRLQRIDAERTRFLTVVAHELRAPINTIHTCIELALAGHASPEKVRDILQRVKERTVELSELISDLLRLARARDEALRDQGAGLVQPAEVLRSVVELMKTEADAKDLFLSMDISTELAPVRANPDRLKLVWTNLLSNAIKYTEPGGIIAVALKQTSEHLIGTVRDTGIGIPNEEQQRIFEEFYRAENARALSPTGTGVGLSIVQRIIENWGGEIWVESELGLGSKFTFILPRADPEDILSRSGMTA